MADSTNSKVVTVENLGTFKTQMEAVIDDKVAAAGSASVEFATNDDILALFSDATDDGTTEDAT